MLTSITQVAGRILIVMTAYAATATAQQPSVPRGIEREQRLPNRHVYVVRDVLKNCQPRPGFWVDLGAGKGQLTIPLVEETGNPVLMVDPDVDAMAEAMQLARDKHIHDRISALVGVAEQLPLLDDSVDLLTSRGSIFFWTDPAQGLREVYRVLRPGGWAYIGGGAGSGYPATQELIASRRAELAGPDAAKWQRFVELRRPEQMRAWAEAAGIPDFEVLGKGAIDPDDGQVGQGVWLKFRKASSNDTLVAPSGAVPAPATARWIWTDAREAAPKNRFTYFRKVFALDELPADGTLRLAADSNARLWINGQLVRRKVARYHEPQITAEVIDVGPYLRIGRNVLVVLHHNWGDIITFQRSANRHAGLWISSSWVASDSSWRWITAPEFLPHESQITGVIGDPRIRYPQVVDGRREMSGNLHDAQFDDGAWQLAYEVTDGPWPQRPDDVETPGQREHAVWPGAVIAAGVARHEQDVTRQAVPDNPLIMAAQIKAARCEPQVDLDVSGLVTGNRVTIAGEAGEVKYITLDFHRPVHGYPFLTIADAAEGLWIDWGYGELARSLYDGAWHVREDGWINPEGVVGKGYADRYITRRGRQHVELPDERTARWLALHVYFPADGQITIESAGIVKSQYPIRRIGTFACGDKQIEQIVELCLTHAEVTMLDAYVDTPGREDGQWIEDARPRAILTERWFGDDRLRKLMIRTLAESQGPDGHLHPFAPSNYPAYPAPYDWSVQWTAMLYDQYQWSGDVDDVRPYWEPLCRYWANLLSHVRDDGLWYTPHLFADIRMGTGCGPDESSGMITPWIIQRLGWSAELADALGETAQGAQWREIADRMSDAFRKFHIVPASGAIPAHVADRFAPRDPGKPRGYSQAGQTVAVLSGLLTRDEAAANLEYAFPAPSGSPPRGVLRWNNPTYGYRALRALSDSGLPGRAVDHLRERYAPYLPSHPRNVVPLALQGPYGGPLPEYWVSREDQGLGEGEINTAQPADETGSHGWNALPLLWLHESLLGVRIIQPGGAQLRIAPHTGGLPWVAGWTMTPKGPVWVEYDPDQWRLEVRIPAGVTAEVPLPAIWGAGPVRVVEHAGSVRPSSDGGWLLTGAGLYVFGR